jgi:alpha-1,6-mannosyltransferase
LITTIFDLMNILILTLLIKTVNKDNFLSGIMIYAWSPLLIIEAAGNGHIEPVPIFFMLLGLFLLVKSRHRLVSISYSSACLSKLFPILLFPIFLIHLKNFNRVKVKQFLLWFTIVSSIFLIPVLLSSGLNLPYQIFWYSQNITYNSSLYRIIELLVPLISTVNIARFVTYSAFVLTGFILLRKKHFTSIIEFVEGSLLLFGLFLLFAPAVFQWYLLWLLPFIAILGIDRKNVGWFYFTAAVILAYLPQFSFDYDINNIALILYLPLYAILILSAFTSNKSFKKSFSD